MIINSYPHTGVSRKFRATTVCLAVNLFLTLLKLCAGILCKAPALISDAAHSASDLFSTVIVLIGIRLSLKAADRRHPYGHARFEGIAAILLSVLLFSVGIAIGYKSIGSIQSGSYLSATLPSAPALAAALLSVLLKLLLFRYLYTVAVQTGSTALRADATHQLTDALASLGTLLGIGASMLGFPIFDPIASVFIALFLLRASVEVFADSVKALVDHAADVATEDALRSVIEDFESIYAVRKLRTRTVGSLLYVEAELLLDGSLSVTEASRITACVEARLRAQNGQICECILLPHAGLSEESESGEKA